MLLVVGEEGFEFFLEIICVAESLIEEFEGELVLVLHLDLSSEIIISKHEIITQLFSIIMTHLVISDLFFLYILQRPKIIYPFITLMTSAVLLI